MVLLDVMPDFDEDEEGGEQVEELQATIQRDYNLKSKGPIPQISPPSPSTRSNKKS
jgi:hypothetical protein